MPVDGIAAEFRKATVLYAQGAPYADGLTLPVPRTMLHPNMTSTEEGLTGEYFASDRFEGKPVLTRVDKEIQFDWNGASPAPGVAAEHFAVRWSGTISAPVQGSYDLSVRLASCYPCEDSETFAVYLDGKQITSFTSPSNAFSRSSATPHFELSFADTKRHELRVEYEHRAKLFGAGLTLEWTPKTEMLRAEAVAAAQKADVVIAFVGLSSSLEGEEMPIHIPGFAGGDRTDIQLPAAQQQMLEAVASTGKPLVVVLLNGSALAVTWAQEHANAILEAWYPGEAGARAIAETLSGTNNPGGRLPITFYTSVDQLPAFDDYSMAKRTYRYFAGKPLYGFGYGLSYTTFTYSGLKLSTAHLRAGDTLTVEADVKNSGKREGDEVAELYLTPPHTTVSPALALAGFSRVHLRDGETRHVRFTLDARTLSQVDANGTRAVNAGSYRLSVGGGQPAGDEAKPLTTGFMVEGTQELPH